MVVARQQLESNVSDLALVRRVIDGDEVAFASLYDRYSGVVYSVARRILNDSGAAEEILQDIFYQLWRTASSFDAERGTLAGWLLVTARNRAIDRLRRRPPEDTQLEVDRAASAGTSLETAAAQSEMTAKVKAAMAELPAPQRQAMELAFFEGLTHSEIADRTQEPLGTIKTRLRSALRTLRRALEG